ncbi:hypothetical protein [Paenibacillus antibioticophila]|uniref:hypothetical protein n=1 Tax=Paenibacillus antibioticophila TaxID=1274374 RepID=UPI001CA34D87|nr:hypothetical protein [Paenibacillus antibioticophila]
MSFAHLIEPAGSIGLRESPDSTSLSHFQPSSVHTFPGLNIRFKSHHSAALRIMSHSEFSEENDIAIRKTSLNMDLVKFLRLELAEKGI